MSWCVLPLLLVTGETHVIPFDELCRHELDVGCWCGPSRDREERRVVIHRDSEGRATA